MSTIITFGKYKGKSLNQIHKINPFYIQWLSINAYDPKLRELSKKLIKQNQNIMNDISIDPDDGLDVGYGGSYNDYEGSPWED